VSIAVHAVVKASRWCALQSAAFCTIVGHTSEWWQTRQLRPPSMEQLDMSVVGLGCQLEHHPHNSKRGLVPKTQDGHHQQTAQATRTGANTTPARQDQAIAVAGPWRSNVSCQPCARRLVGGRAGAAWARAEREVQARRPSPGRESGYQLHVVLCSLPPAAAVLMLCKAQHIMASRTQPYHEKT
jgi:hypothetical protein